MLSLTAGIVSCTLCSTRLGIPVARECRIFHNLETYLSHMMVSGLQMNPSDTASHFLQVYEYVKK
jgi:hypothetical protein